MIHQIVEWNEEITKISIQLNQIDMGVVCKNSELLVRDIQRVPLCLRCDIDSTRKQRFRRKDKAFGEMYLFINKHTHE